MSITCRHSRWDCSNHCSTRRRTRRRNRLKGNRILPNTRHCSTARCSSNWRQGPHIHRLPQSTSQCSTENCLSTNCRLPGRQGHTNLPSSHPSSTASSRCNCRCSARRRHKNRRNTIRCSRPSPTSTLFHWCNRTHILHSHKPVPFLSNTARWYYNPGPWWSKKHTHPHSKCCRRSNSSWRCTNSRRAATARCI